MRKSKKWLLTTWFVLPVFILLLSAFFPQPTQAESCNSFDISYTKSFPTTVSCSNIPNPAIVTVRSGTNQFLTGTTYTLMKSSTANAAAFASIEIASAQASDPSTIRFSITDPQTFNCHPVSGCSWFLILHGPDVGVFPGGCSISGSSSTYTVSQDEWTVDVYARQNRDSQTCYGYPAGCLEAGIPISLEISNIRLCGEPYANESVNIFVEGVGINTASTTNGSGTPAASPLTFTYSSPGIYDIAIGSGSFGFSNIFSSNLNVSDPGGCNSCQTTTPTTSTGQPQEYKICEQISETLSTPTGENAKERCIQCVGGDELGREGIWTAVGCIPRDPDRIVNALLRLGLGLGGGFSLLIILASGFVLSVSQGEPERINQAKQWLTSALVGLLFIIFSVTLLRFIGYTIFQIPGFGG